MDEEEGGGEEETEVGGDEGDELRDNDSLAWGEGVGCEGGEGGECEHEGEQGDERPQRLLREPVKGGDDGGEEGEEE